MSPDTVAQQIQETVGVAWEPGKGLVMPVWGLQVGATEASFEVITEHSSTRPQQRFVVTVYETDAP